MGDREPPNDSSLPEELVDLVQAEREAPGPGSAAHDRVLQRLEQTLGLPPPSGDGGSGGSGASGSDLATTGGAAAGTAAVTAAAGVSKAALVTAVALAFGAGAGAGVLGHARWAPVTAPSVEVRTIVSVQRVVEPASAPPAPAVTSSAEPAPPPSAAAARPRASAVAEPGGRDRALADENALIARAQAALSRGNVAQARAALREHATRFPSGQLSEERRLLEQHTQSLEQAP